jgi:hypothetical protein
MTHKSQIFAKKYCYTNDLTSCTLVGNHVSNMSKIRHHPPTDNNVINFLTNLFPDLYLAPGDFGPEDVMEWMGR